MQQLFFVWVFVVVHAKGTLHLAYKPAKCCITSVDGFDDLATTASTTAASGLASSLLPKPSLSTALSSYFRAGAHNSTKPNSRPNFSTTSWPKMTARRVDEFTTYLKPNHKKLGSSRKKMDKSDDHQGLRVIRHLGPPWYFVNRYVTKQS